MECNQIEVDDVITLSDDQTEFVAQESQQNEVRLMKESFKRIMGLKRVSILIFVPTEYSVSNEKKKTLQCSYFRINDSLIRSRRPFLNLQPWA